MSASIDKSDWKTWAGVFILAIIVVVIFYYMKSKSASSPAASSGGGIPAFLAGVAGPAGTTNPGVLNGLNSSGVPNMAFDTYSYKVPVPSFDYSPTSNYMPLFGFVGMSQYGGG